MGLTLGGNNSSFKNIRYLSESKSKMDKSLLRIASGKRILTAADDSGGLSVAMKLQNQINTTKAAQDRVENSKSFVEMQDTAISTAADILTEMSSVKANYEAEASSNYSSPAALTYAAQFRDLQVQLGNLRTEQFNGISLFSSHSSTSMTVYTGSSGTGGASVTLDNLDFLEAVSIGGSGVVANRNLGDATTAGAVIQNSTSPAPVSGQAVSISDVSSSDLSTITEQLASLRAEAGGDLSTLGFASDYLSNMSVNMESAHGRIMDVDLAEESSNLARYSMQYEAAAAAVAQANVAMGAVLDLLLGSINRK
jgi:flagellin